jgi:hypothetical protein
MSMKYMVKLKLSTTKNVLLYRFTNHPVEMRVSICTGWSLGPVQMSLAPSDMVGGHLYWVEVPPHTNEGFIYYLCFISLTIFFGAPPTL